MGDVLLGFFSSYTSEILAAALLLVAGLFGWLYDAVVVEYVMREWPSNDMTADLVVVGVLAILVFSVPVIGIMNAVFLFSMFAASGVFMVWGSKKRDNVLRKQSDDVLRAGIADILNEAAQHGHEEKEDDEA